MTSLLTRLQTLEDDLTPKLLVLKVLAFMASYPDSEQRLRGIYNKPFLAWQRQNLKNLHTAIKRRIKDKDPETKKYWSRKNRQEFFYLFEIGIWSWRELEHKHYYYLYQFSRLVHIYLKLYGIQNASDKPLLLDEKLKNMIQSLKTGGEKLWVGLLAESLNETKISHSYFDGQSLFMPEQKEFLEEQMSQIKCLMGAYEDLIHELQWNLKQHSQKKGVSEMLAFLEEVSLDHDKIQKKAEQLAGKLFEQAKLSAKINVYENENRHDDAVKTSHALFKFQESLEMDDDSFSGQG